MIDGKIFFDELVKNNKITYENIRKIANCQGDDYTAGCLLDYDYFRDNYKMIAIDLSKQQALDADPRAIQQIDFTVNFDRENNKGIFFILEEAKETILDISQEAVKVLWMYCIIILIYLIKMTQCNSLNVKLSNSQLNKLKSTIKNEDGVVKIIIKHGW